MESYKSDFIKSAIEKGVLSKNGPFTLKSGRKSPYFFNSGNFSDGESAKAVGDAYAAAVLEQIGADKFDVLFGPPYKGIPLVVMMAGSLHEKGVNKRFAFYRKEEKVHGEGTETESRDARKKRLIVGDLRDGDRVVIPDDVITTGGAKYKAIEVMENVVTGAKPVAVVIAMNRQEIDKFGGNAIEELERKSGAKVVATLTASDYFDFLDRSGELADSDRTAFMRYFRAWGTQELRDHYSLKDLDLIEGRTIIPACDMDDIERFESLVKETSDNPRIGGYKVGFQLALGHGLPRVVEVARKHAPQKRIIYDHQKAGADIPDTGAAFARVCKNAGVNAVILFPQSGPVTQVRWVGEALQQGLSVIVGGEMTHEGYKASEGGWIRDDALEEMYLLGAKQGVRHFVVPGTKIDRIGVYRNLLEAEGVDPIFFAPGFVAQGGSISDAGRAAGEKWHAIVGRAIVDAEDMAGAAIKMTSQLSA